MIRYNATAYCGLGIMFQRSGSVLHKCLPQGILAAVVCGLCKMFWIPDSGTLGNLYAHQMLAYVLAYLLVFRSTFSYNRFWEASGSLAYVMSKMGDLLMQTKVFSIQDRTHTNFARRMEHLYMLWIATMFQECLREPDDSSFNGTCAGDLNLFDGLGILDGDEYAEERRILSTAPNRPLVVMSWIAEGWVKRQSDKPRLHPGEPPKPSGVRVGPPVLARCYQTMSEIMVGYNMLLKIACTPVPFPYCQMSVIILTLFCSMWPFVAATVINMNAWSILMAFLVTLGFYAVDAIATELSDPFGDDDNDLPLTELMMQLKVQCQFMRLDVISSRAPEEILQGISPQSTSGTFKETKKHIDT